MQYHVSQMETKMNQLTISDRTKKFVIAAIIALGATLPFLPAIAQACGSGGGGNGGC